MEETNKLKNLLTINLSNLKEREDFLCHFKKLANHLFNNCYIQKGDKEYEMTELEFYLYTEKHQDIITYPRKTNAGDWFFHASGVDLCFKSINVKEENLIDTKERETIKPNMTFGGILIRGLREINSKTTNKEISGPLKCCWELFDQFTALEENISDLKFIYPIIRERKEQSSENIYNQKQRTLNFNNKTKKFNDLNDLYEEKIKDDDFKKFMTEPYKFTRK